MQHILATVVSTILTFMSTSGAESASPAPSLSMKPVTIVRMDKPAYPDFARSNGIEGNVVVEVQVGEDGKAIRVQLTKGDHPVLNSAAISAVANATFAPATMKGSLVKSWAKIPFTFKKK